MSCRHDALSAVTVSSGTLEGAGGMRVTFELPCSNGSSSRYNTTQPHRALFGKSLEDTTAHEVLISKGQLALIGGRVLQSFVVFCGGVTMVTDRTVVVNFLRY